MTEADIDKILTETVETYFYKIKSEERLNWVGRINQVCNKRRPEMHYNDLYKLIDEMSLVHAEKSDYKPKLGKIVRTIIVGRTAGEKESINAVWESMEDCEWCLDGKRHALLWDTPDHCDIHYFVCNCSKGQAMQVPIYVSPYEEIEKMREEHGDRFECGKTKIITQEQVLQLKEQSRKTYNATWDDEEVVGVPF